MFSDFQHDIKNTQDTYTATKWISFSTFLLPFLFSIIYLLFKPLSILPPYLFATSLLFLFPFYFYKRHKNFSRIILSYAAPFLILLLSVIGKFGIIEKDALETVHYYDTRILLLCTVIIPVSTISLLEKGLLAFCILPSFLFLALYDPIHNLFGIGFHQVGFVDSDYYLSVNLFSLFTYAFLLFGLTHLKYKSHVSEIRLFNKGKILEYYLNKLTGLSNSSNINFGNIDLALREICKVAQDCLSIDRVIIWKFIEHEDAIQRMIVLSDNEFKKSDKKLFAENYPNYFKEIKEYGMIVANDVWKHPAISEFDKDYLNKYNVKSSLDAPYINNGKLGGVISCESINKAREWTIEETIFLKALSDFLSYTIIANKLTVYNEELESRIKKRTQELEIKNDQLSEYAFINSHILSAPVARISGLTNLIDNIEGTDMNEFKNHLKNSILELNQITRQINKAIETFGTINRKDLDIENL